MSKCAYNGMTAKPPQLPGYIDRKALTPENVAILRAAGVAVSPALLPPDPEKVAKEEAKTERELQTLCELELSRTGIVYLHLSPKAREKKGWPDLVFVYQRTPIAVELKTLAGKLSEDQDRVLSDMKANGWNVYVIRDFETFRRMLLSVRGDTNVYVSEWQQEERQ